MISFMLSSVDARGLGSYWKQAAILLNELRSCDLDVVVTHKTKPIGPNALSSLINGYMIYIYLRLPREDGCIVFF